MSADGMIVTLKGQVLKPGVYAPRTGENLLDAIFAHAGGMASNRFLLHAVLCGGPQGRFASAATLAAPLTAPVEAMVFDAGSCLVNVTRLLVAFNRTAAGYRGCPSCRAALAAAEDALARLSTLRGGEGDVETLRRLAATKNDACPDGCSALGPLASALELYGGEFAEHGAGRCRASICGELMLSPCANSCPAGVDLPGTIALTQLGRYGDAVALGRHDNPFFLTCGHVCEEPPCQKNCKRLGIDEAIYSQGLHRYAGEKAAAAAGDLEKALGHATLTAGPSSGKRVAVVGGGPAGLAAGWFLARLGHKAVIFEKNPQPGGMAMYGIPAYRLPRAVIAAEIAAVAALGVEIRSGAALGTAVILAELQAEYNAVLLTVGNGKSRRLGIAGEDLPGVVSALDFLYQAADGGAAAVGGRVLVVGGGNVAVDAARTARRLGGEQVTMMCVEDGFEMPASPGEVRAAEEEGIAVRVLSVPLSFAADGGAVRVSYSTVAPGPYDQAGRRWPPTPLSGRAVEEVFDTVIVAIGQQTDLGCLAGSRVASARSCIACDASLATSAAGVFAAGDCAGALNSVVKAVGSGKAAAFAIDRYLTGSDRPLISPLRSKLGCYEGAYCWDTARRAEMPEQALAARIGNFAAVELGLDDSRAAGEMLRCVCAAKGGRF